LDSGVLQFVAVALMYIISPIDFSIFCGFKALFNSLPPEDYVGATLVLGGDGRYFNKEAAQVQLEM